MKIAIFGNMNNNGFALMRYLRDMGVDAHLLLNDNELEHFLPEQDTWNISPWDPYIHRLPFGNNPRHLILKSSKLIKKALASYTHVIGSGLAPAFMYKIGRSLDVFFPYCSGIEWVGTLPSVNKRLSLQYLFHRWVRNHQIKGIRASKFCTNLDFGDMTNQSFALMQVPYYPLGIPMVYVEYGIKDDCIPEELQKIAIAISQSDFVVISHARHHWSRTEDPLSHHSELWKRNDLLIKGFERFLRECKATNPLLVMFSYGPDLSRSKDLVEQLGIRSRILWLDVMPRKWIAYLLKLADVCVGEFTQSGIWGGTAWEGLASGMPVLQSVNFSPEFYKEKTGHELPPFLDVKNEDDVFMHLRNCENNPEETSLIGEKSKYWFDRYQGKNLARKYLELLTQQQDNQTA